MKTFKIQFTVRLDGSIQLFSDNAKMHIECMEGRGHRLFEVKQGRRIAVVLSSTKPNVDRFT